MFCFTQEQLRIGQVEYILSHGRMQFFCAFILHVSYLVYCEHFYSLSAPERPVIFPASLEHPLMDSSSLMIFQFSNFPLYTRFFLFLLVVFCMCIFFYTEFLCFLPFSLQFSLPRVPDCVCGWKE